MAKSGSGQVIQAGGGDVLLFNHTGGEEGPAGILVPAAQAGKVGGKGDAAWQQALKLVKQGSATAIPIGALGKLSESLTSVTLLMPGEDDDGVEDEKPRTSFMRPPPPPKTSAKPKPGGKKK